MARKGSQSYFSSGLGFSGEDRFAREAGVRLSPSTGDDPAASNGGTSTQGKVPEPARAPFASRPTQSGVRREGLNSRFAVKSSAKGLTPSQQVRGSSGSGATEQVSNTSSLDGPQSRKSEPGGEQSEGRRQGVSEGVRFGISGNRGQLSGRADLLGDDLQTKRAAAAAAAYTASLRGNPGTVKPAPRVVRVDTNSQPSGAAGSGKPAVSRSTLFQRGVGGETSGRASAYPNDQEVPTFGRDTKAERFVFGPGLVGAKPPADVSRRVPSVSNTSDVLEAIRNVYGGAEKAEERPPDRETAPGKRTGASGISSFLDLNSPPSGEATFFDAFADAAAGSLGGAQTGFAKQQRRTSNESGDKSANFGVESPAEFSRFLEQAFGLSPLGSMSEQQPGGANGPRESSPGLWESVNDPREGVNAPQAGVNAPQAGVSALQEGVRGPQAGVNGSQGGVNIPQVGVNTTPASVNAPQGREPRRRPFATMYRQKQAENLAQGLGKLDLSKPVVQERSTKESSARTQPTRVAPADNGSLFQTAPEDLFKAPNGPASVKPAFGSSTDERSAKEEIQQEPSRESDVGRGFGLFGAQPKSQSQTQAPSLFQTPPEVLFGRSATPSGFDSSLLSPAFSQSPKADVEKPKAAPQGILPFVFSAGSSGGGSAKSGERNVAEERDSWQFNQSFTERLHLAETKDQEEIPFSTAASLEGSRGFLFKGSVPDEESARASQGFGKNANRGVFHDSSDRGVFGENLPAAKGTSTGAPRVVNSPPVFGGGVSGVTGTSLDPGFVAFDGSAEGSPGAPGVTGNPPNPGFVAFGSAEGSPGTPAKRKSEQKLAKKASPGGRNAFTSTRTLQRTPPAKPPIPASPSAQVTETGSGVSETKGSDRLNGNERGESPQPMDISPGRDFLASAVDNGQVWEERGTGSGAAPGVNGPEADVKRGGEMNAASDSWQSAGASGVTGKSAESKREGVNALRRAVNAEQKYASSEISANAPQAKGKRSQGRSNGRLGGVNGRFGGVNGRFGGVNGPLGGVNRSQLGASYDGDSEEGNSSFEESETDKRVTEGGAAWTGKWSPPKEPYEYDSSESSSESEEEVNAEAWVKGEKEKLERLKKTEGGGGADVEDSGFESVLEEENVAARAKQVEVLGAEVEEMDLGSVEETGGGVESDVGNEAESAASFGEEPREPATGVGFPSGEPVTGAKESESRQGAREAPPVGAYQENGPAQGTGEKTAAPFVFGAGKPKEDASTGSAAVPNSTQFSTNGPAPPVAAPFVFTSGPTMPKSPKRSSGLRRSTDRSDPLRRSTDSGRRRSSEKRSLNRSVDGVGGAGEAGLFARGFPPGPEAGPGQSFPAAQGFSPGADEPTAPESSTVPEWGPGFKSARFSASSQPAFPSTCTPTSAGPPNPFTASSSTPNLSEFLNLSFATAATFPTSPDFASPVSPNPIPESVANPASSKLGVPAPEPASPGPVPASKPIRKARRVGPNKARQSWEAPQNASKLGENIPLDSVLNRTASPEAMDEGSADAKQQGAAARNPSRSYLYYPESAMSYAQMFGTDGGSSTPVGGSESEGAANAQAQTTPVAAKAARAAATCERWRLKGNQAYATKDYRGAEALYTKGVDAVMSLEGLVHEGCEKAAAVCLSNRAAVRMALGRVREALSDCRRATAADPDFTKVRLREANCHVILGEFGAAQAVFTESADRGGKVAAEANEGLARAGELYALTAKIAELLECSELLDSSPPSGLAASNGQVSQSGAASASQIFARPFRQVSAIRAAEAQKLLAGALIAAPHSEPLLQMRALSLLWVRSFDEVLAFCASSLAASEVNACVGNDGALGAGGQSGSLRAGMSLEGGRMGSNGVRTVSDGDRTRLDGSEMLSDGDRTGLEGVRMWRWRVSALAQYHLGKVEEADVLAGKVEAMTGVSAGLAGAVATEETLGGLRAFIKDLQKHKAAGNTEFQSGRREAAIEHYSAALGCNSSSRPFNAVCLANRAAAYQALGSFAEAIADCSRAIVLDPGYAKALSRRATLHDLIRDHSESVRDLERLSGLLTARQSSGQRDPQLAQEIRAVAERKRKASEAAQKEIPVDHYKVLGVEKDGGEAEVKKAYRKAALRHHPDKAVQFLSMLKDEEKAAVTEEIHSEAERLFKLIGEAYNVLSDPSKRMAYDADEEDRTFRTSVRPFGRSTSSQGFSRSTGGRSSWTNANVRRPFDSEWAEDFFGRKGRGTSKSRSESHSDYYWDADFY